MKSILKRFVFDIVYNKHNKGYKFLLIKSSFRMFRNVILFFAQLIQYNLLNIT